MGLLGVRGNYIRSNQSLSEKSKLYTRLSRNFQGPTKINLDQSPIMKSSFQTLSLAIVAGTLATTYASPALYRWALKSTHTTGFELIKKSA
jgi:hypothetical protein